MGAPTCPKGQGVRLHWHDVADGQAVTFARQVAVAAMLAVCEGGGGTELGCASHYIGPRGLV